MEEVGVDVVGVEDDDVEVLLVLLLSVDVDDEDVDVLPMLVIDADVLDVGEENVEVLRLVAVSLVVPLLLWLCLM